MIVVGICAGPNERFEQFVEPSLAADAAYITLVVLREQRSIAAAYNQVLDAAKQVADLEAVLLIHDDVEIVDHEWRTKLLGSLAGGGVTVVGVIGARGPGGMAWFSRPEKLGAVREPHAAYDFGGRSEDVDVIDGLFIGLSPAATHNLRFDETRYPPFHGYDADICSQALASGGRVTLTPIEAIHHTTGAFGTERSYIDWVKATLAWRLRWVPSSRTKRAIWRGRIVLLPAEVRLRSAARSRRRALRSRSAPADGPVTP